MCANKRFSFYINKNYMMPFILDKANLTIGMTWCLFETKTELCFDVFQSTDKRCNDAKARAIGKAESLFLLNLLKFFPATHGWFSTTVRTIRLKFLVFLGMEPIK